MKWNVNVPGDLKSSVITRSIVAGTYIAAMIQSSVIRMQPQLTLIRHHSSNIIAMIHWSFTYSYRQ